MDFSWCCFTASNIKLLLYINIVEKYRQMKYDSLFFCFIPISPLQSCVHHLMIVVPLQRRMCIPGVCSGPKNFGMWCLFAQYIRILKPSSRLHFLLDLVGALVCVVLQQGCMFKNRMFARDLRKQRVFAICQPSFNSLYCLILHFTEADRLIKL